MSLVRKTCRKEGRRKFTRSDEYSWEGKHTLSLRDDVDISNIGCSDWKPSAKDYKLRESGEERVEAESGRGDRGSIRTNVCKVQGNGGNCRF